MSLQNWNNSKYIPGGEIFGESRWHRFGVPKFFFAKNVSLAIFLFVSPFRSDFIFFLIKLHNSSLEHYFFELKLLLIIYSHISHFKVRRIHLLPYVLILIISHICIILSCIVHYCGYHLNVQPTGCRFNISIRVEFIGKKALGYYICEAHPSLSLLQVKEKAIEDHLNIFLLYNLIKFFMKRSLIISAVTLPISLCLTNVSAPI